MSGLGIVFIRFRVRADVEMRSDEQRREWIKRQVLGSGSGFLHSVFIWQGSWSESMEGRGEDWIGARDQCWSPSLEGEASVSVRAGDLVLVLVTTSSLGDLLLAGRPHPPSAVVKGHGSRVSVSVTVRLLLYVFCCQGSGSGKGKTRGDEDRGWK